MKRSSTAFFQLLDRLKPARRGTEVDRVFPAGRPQQNPLESYGWCAAFCVFTALLLVWGGQVAAIPPALTVLFLLPATFLALHLVALTMAVLAWLVAGGRGFLHFLWVAVYTGAALWCLTIPESLPRWTGGLWLIWIVANLMAWVINKGCPPCSGPSSSPPS